MSSCKLIIDVDTGVDDAQSIMMALSHSPNVQVLAITCVGGNTSLENVCKNTYRVLNLCNRLDVPAFRGAHKALVGQLKRDKYVHGDDGLGDTGDDTHHVNVDDYIKQEHAAQAMIRLVNQFKGEITLVTLAPLTNIALAIKLDPEFCTKLKRMVIMGGSDNAIGNETTTAEFNFWGDPEAANIVLSEGKIIPQIVGWDMCMDTTLEWEWYDEVLCQIGTEKGKFQQLINKNMTTRKRTYQPGYFTCDPTAMCVAINPDAVLDHRLCQATVELNGIHTRGQLIIEKRRKITIEPNVDMVLKVDTNVLKQYMEMMLKK